MKFTRNLYKDIEFKTIMIFINETKVELIGENKNLLFYDKKKKNKCFEEYLYLRANNIYFFSISNIFKDINSKINITKEIQDEEYCFNYIISDKYSKNLEIRIPSFNIFDIFYFIFIFDKTVKNKKKFKLILLFV